MIRRSDHEHGKGSNQVNRGPKGIIGWDSTRTLVHYRRSFAYSIAAPTSLDGDIERVAEVVHRKLPSELS
jgi:hypothetical protein